MNAERIVSRLDSSTIVRFTLSATEHVTVTVRNTLGQTVAVLMDDVVPAGSHRVEWIVDDNTPRGVYFFTVETASGSVTRSEVLMK